MLECDWRGGALIYSRQARISASSLTCVLEDVRGLMVFTLLAELDLRFGVDHAVAFALAKVPEGALYRPAEVAGEVT